jgi:hypothetical protein
MSTDAGILLSLFFDPEDGGNVPPKRQLTLNGLQGVINQPSRWFLVKLNFSTLKMEAICSSETSVDTQRTTRRYKSAFTLVSC